MLVPSMRMPVAAYSPGHEVVPSENALHRQIDEDAQHGDSEHEFAVDRLHIPFEEFPDTLHGLPHEDAGEDPDEESAGE